MPMQTSVNDTLTYKAKQCNKKKYMDALIAQSESVGGALSVNADCKSWLTLKTH